MGAGAKTAIAVLLAWSSCWRPGVVPSVIAGLLAAFAMVLFRAVTVEQAYRSINWTTVILVGAMIPLSTAMAKSGAANAGRRAGAYGRRAEPVCAAGRPVRADGDPGPVDQQHGDRTDHHSHRGRGGGDRHFGAAGADERRRSRRRVRS